MNPFDTKRLSDAYTAYLPIPAKLEPHLEGALHHVLRNPGNLIRPQIAFQMSVAYDLLDAHATELAIALEYFHTASLLFDDLPCMDHAIERRGTQCVHVCFGESGAILAALAFINRAYSLTWRAVSTCLPQRQSRAITYLEQQLVSCPGDNESSRHTSNEHGTVWQLAHSLP